MVSVVSDDAHLLRPVVNPGAVSNTNLASGGAGTFNGVAITAPASASLIIAEIANDSLVSLVNVSYAGPGGFIDTGAHAHLVTPGGATLASTQRAFTGTTVVPGDLTLDVTPLLGSIADALAIVVDPGETLFIGSVTADVIFAVRYAFTEVG